MKSRVIIIVFIVSTLIGIPLALYLVGQQQETRSRASANSAPQNVKITNISDNSFAVSWTTLDKTIGALSIGNAEPLSSQAFDDRAEGIDQTPRITHHVTVKQLSSQTIYLFKIQSNSTSYDNNAIPYKVKTAPITTAAPPVAKSLFGKITKKDGTAPTEAVVYVTIPEATLLSTITKNDGNYLITLNNARTLDLTNYKTFAPSGENISLEVVTDTMDTAKARVNTEATSGSQYENQIVATGLI